MRTPWWVAVVALSLAGCGATGGDRDAVALGLGSLGSEWTVNGVEISKSNSEGLVGEVFVWVDDDGASQELAEPWALGPSCDRGEISGSASFFIDIVRDNS